MLYRTIDKIICPYCSNQQNMTFWTVVNADENTRIRKKILDGTFFEQTCKSCGEIHYVTYPMLYQDDTNRFMLYHTSGILEISTAQQAIEKRRNIISARNDYRIRIVTSPNELREKTRIFEKNLDDRVIEIIKVLVLERLSEQKLAGHIDEILCWICDNGDMDIDVLADTTGALTLEKDFYNYVESKTKILLNSQEPNPSEVNLDFAIDFLTRNRFIFEK